MWTDADLIVFRLAGIDLDGLKRKVGRIMGQIDSGYVREDTVTGCAQAIADTITAAVFHGDLRERLFRHLQGHVNSLRAFIRVRQSLSDSEYRNRVSATSLEQWKLGGGIVVTSHDAIYGRLRYKWYRDALAILNTAEARLAEPGGA